MTFWIDVRLAARLLLKDKWFTLAAVAALALGIAANNTVFTIVNGVLLRDLPFEDPDRIVAVAVGLAAGIAGAVFVSRAVPVAITRVEGTEPVTLGAAIALLLGVALGACLIPGRRAMRLNPVEALRSE